MRYMTDEQSAWETQNEKSKALIRWGIIIAIFSYFSYILFTVGKPQKFSHFFNWTFVNSLSGIFVFINLIITIYLFQVKSDRWKMSRAFKYITMSLDIIFISLLLILTGVQSNFFLIYFIVIISNSIRYGMKVAIFGNFSVNLCYIGTLIFIYYPHLKVESLSEEFLKILTFWIVGMYTGFLAWRFQNLRTEVEKYKKLVVKLTTPNTDGKS